MAKRVNPQRRLRQRQAAALAAVRLEQSAANAAEMSKLQQGHVRSGLRGNPTTQTFKAPRSLIPSEPDVKSAKTGKLFPPQFEGGRGKPKRAAPKRFSLK
jgi:hypothetical protein